MLFIALMSLSTTAVASIAAFFSVYGLAHTFTGAFWSVVAMGSSLEAGKLMLASFVYRFKDVIGWRIKTPAYAFIFVLMMITSIGIYGYLSAAYQAESAGGQQVSASMELKKQSQATLQQRKVQIDQQIAQLPTNNVRGRQQLMRQFAPEEKQIDEQLAKVNQEIQDLSQQQITSNAHIGPIVYIAKVLGMEPDSAIAILICFIIVVFDPLAMLLTISTNVAIEDYYKKKAAAKEAKKAADADDELVFRGKGWEPKKEAPYDPLALDEVFYSNGSEPKKEDPADYFFSTDRPANLPVGWSVTEPSGMMEDFAGGSLPKVEPDVGPEVTGNWAIDRYNEDYWEPDARVEPEVMEHGSEETSPEVFPVEQKEPEPIYPDWVQGIPEFEFKDEPEPVVIEQEEVKPLNEEPVYEMGEAKPLNEEPVYDMQQLEVSPIQEIKQIEQEIDQKPDLSHEEQEMRDMIKRFFARQDLIRSTRRD